MTEKRPKTCLLVKCRPGPPPVRGVLVPLAVEAVLEAVPALLHHGEDGLEEHLQGRADEVLQDQFQIHLEMNACMG